MNATSYAAAAVIDLIVVAISALTLGIALARGMFEAGTTPRTGRLLIAAGILVTAAWCLADLLSMFVLPLVADDAARLAIVSILQIQARGAVTLLSALLIASGFIAVALQRPLVEQKMRTASAQVQRAEATVIDSENRFRALVDQFTDPLYCFEFRPPIETRSSLDKQRKASYAGVLADCNDNFVRWFGRERPAEVQGTELSALDFATDAQAYRAFFTAFVDSGYRLAEFDLAYRGAAGEERALKLHARGVIEEGALAAVWISHRDVLAERQTRQALRVRERFQDTLEDVSTRLLTARHDRIGAAVEQSLGDVCRHVGANRALLVWFDADDGSADVVSSWFDGEASPDPAGQRVVASIALAQPPDEPTAYGPGAAPIGGTNAGDCARALSELGVTSAAFVPLVVEGARRGCCFVASQGPTVAWSPQMLTDLQVFGELLASSVSRLKSRQRLDLALQELEFAKDRLEAENVYLQEEIRSTHGFREIVGESSDLRRCLRQVEQVAKTSTPVLILGETGTGKELIARALHERGSRGRRPLVKVNCAALPANLIESELFGHEAGAFTGAQSRKRGRFDLADGGSLFLDEIGDFPLDLQGKILRVLEDGEFQRLGGTETIQVDVRIIAATNRDLRRAVEDGDFRADLYYRISTFTIELPPLRQRIGDVALLAAHFVDKHAASLGKRVRKISPGMRDQLESYAWPGNVRELENVVQRALLTSNEVALSLDEPLDHPASAAEPADAGPLDLRTAERAHIRAVLDKTGWRVSGERGAAERLGLPASTLRSRMKKLGLSREGVA